MFEIIKKYLVLSLLLISISKSSIAQNKLTDYKFSSSIHHGLAFPEYQFLSYLTNDYIQSLDISVLKTTNGKNYWQKLFNYPDYGWSIFYSTLGNNQILGSEIALNYFIRVPFIIKPKFNFYYQIGTGLTYATKKYNAITNYQNLAIGSHVNISFAARAGYRLKLTKSTKLNLGVTFNHLSNGNTTDPNLGLNYFTAFTGLIVNLGPESEKLDIEAPKHEIKNYLQVTLGYGGKKNRSITDKYYTTSSISIKGVREYARFFHLGVGLDIFYNSSIQSQLNAVNKSFKPSNNFQTGLHISQNIHYDKFSFALSQGVYLGLKDAVNNKPLYNRVVVSYRVLKNIEVNFLMKSHILILDYPEFGLTYSFK